MKSIPWQVLALALLTAGCQSPPFQSGSTSISDKSGDGSWADRNPLGSAGGRASRKPWDILRGGRRREQRAAIAARLSRAGTAYKGGRFAEAAALYEQVLKIDPGNPEAHHKLGNIADRRHDFGTAERHYAAAKAVRPDDANLLNDMGYSKFLQGRYTESEQLLHAALNKQPRHQRALYNLGWLYGTQGDARRAYEYFRQAGSEADAERMMARLFPDGIPAGSRGLAASSNYANRGRSLHAPSPHQPLNDVDGRFRQTGYERRYAPSEQTRRLLDQMRQQGRSSGDRGTGGERSSAGAGVTPWNERGRNAENDFRDLGRFRGSRYGDKGSGDSRDVMPSGDRRFSSRSAYDAQRDESGSRGIVITPRGGSPSRYGDRSYDRRSDDGGRGRSEREADVDGRTLRGSFDDNPGRRSGPSSRRDPLKFPPDGATGTDRSRTGVLNSTYSGGGNPVRPASSTRYGSEDFGRGTTTRSRYEGSRYETYTPGGRGDRAALDPARREALRMGHNAGTGGNPFPMLPNRQTTGDDSRYPASSRDRMPDFDHGAAAGGGSYSNSRSRGRISGVTGESGGSGRTDSGGRFATLPEPPGNARIPPDDAGDAYKDGNRSSSRGGYDDGGSYGRRDSRYDATIGPRDAYGSSFDRR